MTRTPARRQPPGPRGVPLVGSYFPARTDPLRLFSEGRARHGDVVRYRFGPLPYVALTSPSAIEHVFIKNRTNYRRSRSYRVIKPALGSGLLTEDGEAWQRPRRRTMAHLGRHRLATLATHVVKGIADTLDEWTQRKDPVIDLRVEMIRLTLRTTGHWLFGTDIADAAASISQASDGLLRIVHERSKSPLQMLPLRLPTPTRRRFRAMRMQLDTTVQAALAAHRAEPDAYDDVLTGLLDRDETHGPALSDTEIHDAALTLLVAGTESMGASLTWAWTLLAQHPEVAARLRAEADDVLGSRAPTSEDAAKLTYAGRVFDEVLRLYPAAWMIERRPIEDDEIDGYHVPRGTTVGACVWALHRSPALFDDPHRFEPDRFLPERRSAWHRCAYIPYGVGQQTCAGGWLAWMQGRLVLALLAQRFTIDVHAPDDVTPDAGMIMRPRDGIPATLRPRA